MFLKKIFVSFLILFSLASCGVKGNPQPPLTEEEMLLQTEREEAEQRALEEKQKKHLEKIKAASTKKSNPKKSGKTK